LLAHAARYLTQDPTREDILSTFAGLRPLVSLGSHENTAAISRDHTLNISRSGLLTITGGKWTTYRKMAEETVDQAILLAQLQERPSVTRDLNIHGFHQNAVQFGHLAVYGADARSVREVLGEDTRYAKPLHPDHPYLAGEVVWAVRREMARTVEDFLSRRRRVLPTDARASIEMAPAVATLMARELGRDSRWADDQTTAFEDLARGYLADGRCRLKTKNSGEIPS
ncbi:MAG: glycerol-3-phosphate dehydrogenase C-terminal domain-containing protein, partial [Desulfococcus multivorans]|nr:glycerol-3-phosphate dehydrogenase C-terminal domain-containing protein [Desulfococcus multivorans]